MIEELRKRTRQKMITILIVLVCLLMMAFATDRQIEDLKERIERLEAKK